MPRDGGQRVEADAALADTLVAVLVRVARVLAVVQMHGFEARKADDAVEFSTVGMTADESVDKIIGQCGLEKK